MNPDRSTRVRSALSLAFTGVTASVIAAAAGSAATRLIAPSVRNRYFPWITGRALGIAAYLALTALVMLGAWMRHPWRLRRPFVHAEARLRAHAVLAVATVILVVGHISALAADSYAGVGWWGALIPGKSHYRTLPVALGVVGFWAMVLLTMTAGLAGRRGTTHWPICGPHFRLGVAARGSFGDGHLATSGSLSRDRPRDRGTGVDSSSRVGVSGTCGALRRRAEVSGVGI